MSNSLWNRYRSVPLVYRIGVGFILGGLLGLVVGKPAAALEPLGTLFLRLLKMLVVPLIVFTLLSGVKQLTPAKLGRIGGSVVGLILQRPPSLVLLVLSLQTY